MSLQGWPPSSRPVPPTPTECQLPVWLTTFYSYVQNAKRHRWNQFRFHFTQYIQDSIISYEINTKIINKIFTVFVDIKSLKPGVHSPTSPFGPAACQVGPCGHMWPAATTLGSWGLRDALACADRGSPWWWGAEGQDWWPPRSLVARGRGEEQDQGK